MQFVFTSVAVRLAPYAKDARAESFRRRGGPQGGGRASEGHCGISRLEETAGNRDARPRAATFRCPLLREPRVAAEKEREREVWYNGILVISWR